VTERITDEADLITRYLAPLARGVAGAFGLNDDAALIETEPGVDLVVTNDAVRSGVHFFADDDARDIAWKALAVNVSDLVAKGAEPVGYVMALAFPEAPLAAWMERLVLGLKQAQDAFGLQLMGGDTDRAPGPLSISVTAFGAVPREGFVPRSGARPGDHVLVSGTLGDSALGLKLRAGNSGDEFALSEAHRAGLIGRYLRPEPRLALIPVLRSYATAALDISDGLVKDLGRLAAGAGAGIEVRYADLPLSEAARAACHQSRDTVERAVLAGGDDYEVLFAVTEGDLPDVLAEAEAAGVPVTEIGVLTPGDGVRVVGENGQDVTPDISGFDHFA
jgi:thiamine-monophosphate kinase